MPHIPESHAETSPVHPPEAAAEQQVLEVARGYARAQQWAGELHRARVLAIEDERLADCDFHAASNDRFADNLAADDRTMGFTGTTVAPSGDGPMDGASGAASHRYQVLLEARKRLDVLCDRADRELDEAHGALLATTVGLLPSGEARVEEGTVSEEPAEDREAGFDLLVGGGTDAAAEVEAGAEGVTSAA